MKTLTKIKKSFRNILLRKNPELLFKINFFCLQGKWLNTKRPKTLYDRIAHNMFHTDTSAWSILADKVRVRDYATELGYGEYLPKLYGVYDSSSEIKYDMLPTQFVLKTNNASATNIIVFDKTSIDINKTNKQLDAWLKMPYGYLTCQPHYSKIKPLILAEELLVDEETTKQGKMLIDYKFFCINGKPRYVMVMSDRIPGSHTVKIMIYDMEWEPNKQYVNHEDLAASPDKKPASFDVMKKMAAALANDFEFVRVDFYEINGKPILGELTFSPGISAISHMLNEDLGKELNKK